MESDRKTITVTADAAGLRLDKFIADRCPEVSRTQFQRIIAGGHVTVNGRSARASLKLEAGDEVVVELPPPTPTTLFPEAIPVDIVYEDDDLLVVDKPAGLTVHPAPGHPDHTLANAILSLLPQLDTGDWQRPGIVHRLDKDTSGLIIVAKNAQAHENLTDQFKQRAVDKVYVTLVQGHPTPQEGSIEAPIGRDRSHRERMAITDEEHGREARTNYRVIRHVGQYSLLEVKPETGRTHQIRVHLAAVGHPVVGDRVYGVKVPFLDRQFLHAARIGFRLPSTGQHVEFQSDLPADLERALERIGTEHGVKGG
ncbi:MAG: pseudouridine synthase [Chloroflexi bacterium RBG_16_57_8]|nr:MAG: pseudouridine synthase [Chloroflexi bacterium RBG_16_57_8]